MAGKNPKQLRRDRDSPPEQRQSGHGDRLVGNHRFGIHGRDGHL